MVSLTAPAKDEVEVEFNYNTAEARMLNSDAKLFVRPFVADLQLIAQPAAKDGVAPRINWEKTFTAKEYLSLAVVDKKGGIVFDATETNIKNHVVYLASVGKLAPLNYSAIEFDILVAPLFDFTLDQNSCTIRFTGYPARYTNWQPATALQYQEWIQSHENGRTETRRGVTGNVGVQQVDVIKDNERAEAVKGLIGR